MTSVDLESVVHVLARHLPLSTLAVILTELAELDSPIPFSLSEPFETLTEADFITEVPMSGETMPSPESDK